MRFELMRSLSIALAGLRLNHSAKMPYILTCNIISKPLQSIALPTELSPVIVPPTKYIVGFCLCSFLQIYIYVFICVFLFSRCNV